jgi:predicted enzyme related to lactoylglutathione lyase
MESPMNRVCHFEVPYDDKDRASKFYADVFGWGIQHMSEMDYSFAITTEVDEKQAPTKAGGINGGLYKRDDSGASKAPVLVIEVENCETHTKKATDAGAKVVVAPHPVGTFGIYSQVTDTEGNNIGLWQSVARA